MAYDRNLIHTNLIIHLEQAKVYADVMIRDMEVSRDYRRKLALTRSHIAGVLNFVADVQGFDYKQHEETSAEVGEKVNEIIKEALYGSTEGK